MRITVRLFAMQREQVGAKVVALELAEGARVEDAWAAMSPMARSFWAENRRVSAAGTKAALGIEWLYPTYREGLRAILAQELGHGCA